MSPPLNHQPFDAATPGFIRSLRHRNYRLYFFGQLISLPGNWIQNIALGWLVYRLTDSALLLGIVGFSGQIPSLFLTPLAGVFADRTGRRKILLTTQTVSMLIALSVSVLIFSGHIKVWHIILSAVLNGISVAFDTPFRHAFLVNMVPDKKDLQNAIALNSTLFNTARFAGPPLGGLLIAVSGEAVCFLINGLSYLAVIWSLSLMKVNENPVKTEKASVLTDLLQGVQYSWKEAPIRILLLMVITTSLLGLPFQVFMPVFAREVLQGDSRTLGYLIGAIGAGALTGAVFLATRRTLGGIPLIILISALMFSAGLMAFSASPTLLLSVLLLVITGFGMVVEFASSNTLLQTLVDDRMRGRVVALYSMSFMGFTPLGSLLTGWLAEIAGVQFTVFVAGFCCLIAALFFYRKLNVIRKAIARQ
ncbi:MAG: MFS transporter [Bacteroidales bacterium]|nr:MFS transporter [Bacteroidales bacterium]